MTRKIETEMIAAIANGKEWQKDNTMVCRNCMATTGPVVMSVYLYGNLIAEIIGGQVIKLCFGSRDHFSRTTFSRLNAILRQWAKPGIGLYTYKHQPMLAGLAATGDIELEVGDTWTCNLYR
ncbi:hypothetical protein S-CBP42_0032 [Synechococcus phage S-CBP42]|nr:hypothetical protein AVU76_gp32 [Synechococcus phage S-CBP42]AGK86683.1 hypothetical protein S-CBP42_0032 [Synechococcus phage S-CBP42]